MYEEKKDKVMRVLSIYKRLMEGDIINKEAEANYYNVTTRSIQRDIDDIRSFMDMENSKTGVLNSVMVKFFLYVRYFLIAEPLLKRK